MSRLMDLDNESFKLFNISDNVFISNSLNDNFQTINSSKTNNVYKSKKLLEKHRKIPSLLELEKIAHAYFKNLYYHDKYFYNIKVINEIINNCDSHLVAEFKDYLIMGDESEFLQRKYKLSECKKYLPILFDYYRSCSIIFPNYVILHENKYIFKNIRKKQKVIDNQQEQDDKKEKNKNGDRNEGNNDFFNTKAWYSILNQTNTSNLKMFFGIKHSKSKNNDSEESVNIIFKNIVKAEKNASLALKNINIKKKSLKNFVNMYKNDSSKSKITKIIKMKLSKGKKLNNNNNNSKYSLKNKNNENEKSKNNLNTTNNTNINNIIDKRINNDYDRDNNYNSGNITILYSNINNLNKQKNIIKKNYKTKHVKSNTCIFETDSNNFYQKKAPTVNTGSLTNRNIVKINNSNRKIVRAKNKNSKEKKISKENKGIITKLLSKIKNPKNLVIQGNHSYNNINLKRSILNMKRFYNPSSISRHNKTNSTIKRKNNSKLMININESNSTPNMYKLKNNKNNKNSKNKKLKEEKDKDKEKKHQYQLLNYKNNGNISPFEKILIKNNSHQLRNSKNHHLHNNFISKTSKNKMKKAEKERQKVNLNVYKITPYVNSQRYITTNSNKNDCPRLSNKIITISGVKRNISGYKFSRIKADKKKTILNSKKKRKYDINNNININININSNNIFNNTNQTNNYSLSNSIYTHSISNSILNKKKYNELLRQSSSFVFKKDNNHRQMLKKMLLSSMSNNSIFNNSKKNNNITEDIHKKKYLVLNTNNTLSFSRCLTYRNSQNSSIIKNTVKKSNKNRLGNIKSHISSYKAKKDLFNKKEKIIYSKNKIPIVKIQKEK